MHRLIIMAAFGVAFVIFMAIKYISRHARTGVAAARRAADAITDGTGGGLHAHYHDHVEED